MSAQPASRSPLPSARLQIGLVFANKRVFYKQRDNHFFPAASYVGSLLLTQLPQSFIEVTVFSLLLYWVRAPAWKHSRTEALGHLGPACSGHMSSLARDMPAPLVPRPRRSPASPAAPATSSSSG